MAEDRGIPSANTLLTFTCSNEQVTDSAGNPAEIVQTPFTVSTDLVFAGSFAPFIVALLQLFGATYTVTYSNESESTGTGGTLGTDSGAIAGLTTTSTLTVTTLAPDDVYELTGLVKFTVPGFTGTVPITGSFDELNVQVTS